MQAGLWWELEGQADLEERAKFNCEVQQFSGVGRNPDHTNPSGPLLSPLLAACNPLYNVYKQTHMKWSSGGDGT